MSQAEFSVHLGGGLYMDSNGVLSRGPEPGKPAYATPGPGLPVSLDALATAFQGMAKALPDKDDENSIKKFDDIFRGIGMLSEDRANLISILQTAGKIASVIGSVVPVVGAALAVLTMLIGLFKDGPTAFEVMVTQRFDELDRRVKALQLLITEHRLQDQRSVIATAVAEINGYLEQLRNMPPDEAKLLLLYRTRLLGQ